MEVLQTEKNKLADSLADIAHQLKTPLTSMLLMMDLLESAPPEKQKEFFDGIRKNLIHTEWLVTTLLKMAKLDAGTVSFTPAQMNTDELVREAVRPLAIMLDIKNQRVKVNGEHLFTCDKRWTAEALTNIIKNASEHSPEGESSPFPPEAPQSAPISALPTAEPVFQPRNCQNYSGDSRVLKANEGLESDCRLPLLF